MSGQQTQLTGKRRGPAPTGVGTLVGVRLHPPQLRALDSWIEQEGGELSRPEAVRRILGAVLGVAPPPQRD